MARLAVACSNPRHLVAVSVPRARVDITRWFTTPIAVIVLVARVAGCAVGSRVSRVASAHRHARDVIASTVA